MICVIQGPNCTNDGNGPGQRCYPCEVSIRASEKTRIEALAVAMGCHPDDVNPATLAVVGKALGCEWQTVTADKILPKQAEVRAAVAAVRGKS